MTCPSDALNTPASPVPLSSLAAGSRATVHQRLHAEDDCQLLAAMGLKDRCNLKVCRAGNPCIVQVATSRLGLSAEMAARILVHPTISAAPV